MTKPEIGTTGTRLVYENRWMRVREDAIVRANGATGIYGVVEKPDFAVIAAVLDESIFLVEQLRYPVGQRFWELPQGSWELGEPDPVTLARHELREETGLLAGCMTQVAELFPAYGYAAQRFHLFLATELQQGARQLDPEEQGLVCQEFSVRVLERMILDGTIKDATTVAAFGLLRLKGLL